MIAIIKGNFISCNEIKTKDGTVYHRASILSGDDKVEIGFNSSTMPIYYELNQLKRFQEVELECSITVYNNKLYIDPVMSDNRSLPE